MAAFYSVAVLLATSLEHSSDLNVIIVSAQAASFVSSVSDKLAGGKFNFV